MSTEFVSAGCKNIATEKGTRLPNKHLLTFKDEF